MVEISSNTSQHEIFALQDAVNTVCEFLEITPVVADSNDTLDSLTVKISSGIDSTFARNMVESSTDYTSLRLHNLLNAMIIKNGCEKSSELKIDDDALRSLYYINVKKLDKVMKDLVREYCANGCNLGEFRCCTGDSHKSEFRDPEILKLQMIESKYSGPTRKDSYAGCIYLGYSGCTLTISKSPACIGFICDRLDNYVRKVAPVNAVNFIGALNEVTDTTFDTITPQKIFGFDHAIHYGRLAVDEKISAK